MDAKSTTDFHPECRFVEVSRLIEIIHINVYQDLHGVIRGIRACVGAAVRPRLLNDLEVLLYSRTTDAPDERLGVRNLPLDQAAAGSSDCQDILDARIENG
jgi:hypothetical protein